MVSVDLLIRIPPVSSLLGGTILPGVAPIVLEGLNLLHLVDLFLLFLTSDNQVMAVFLRQFYLVWFDHPGRLVKVLMVQSLLHCQPIAWVQNQKFIYQVYQRIGYRVL